MKALKRLWPDTEVDSKPVERVKRNYQDRGAARDGPDIEAPGLSGEVKHRERTDIQSAIRGAVENQTEGTAWFAVDYPTSGPRKTPVIVLDLDAFVDLVLRERVIANQKGFDDGYAEGLADSGIVNMPDDERRDP